MNTRKLLTATMASAMALGTIGGAYAASRTAPTAKEVIAAMAANKTLTDAVRLAEDATKGKAFEADLGADSAGPVYDIEVANADGVVTKVSVNGVTGAILKAGPATDDHDDDHDGEDDNG